MNRTKLQPMLYYRKRFKNVSRGRFEQAFGKYPEIIDFLDFHLKDTSKCYTGFFNFLIYKMNDLGLKGASELIEKYDIELVQFLIEHENNNKKAALKTANNTALGRKEEKSRA